jgi:hypothetical protein
LFLTLQVRYDDGDSESAVAPRCIRAKPALLAAASQPAAARSAFANAASVFDLSEPSDDDAAAAAGSSVEAAAPLAATTRSATALAAEDIHAPRDCKAGDAAPSDAAADPAHAPTAHAPRAPAAIAGAPGGAAAPGADSTAAAACFRDGGHSEVARLTALLAREVAARAALEAQLHAARSAPQAHRAACPAAAALASPEAAAAAALAKAARSLVLLREAPTRWDQHRARVLRSYAAEAIARGQEVVQLKHALARQAQSAAAGAPAARAATAAAASLLLPPPPPGLGRKGAGRRQGGFAVPGFAPGSARGRAVRFVAAQGGLGEQLAERCEAFFGCADLEALAEDADAKVG